MKLFFLTTFSLILTSINIAFYLAYSQPSVLRATDLSNLQIEYVLDISRFNYFYSKQNNKLIIQDAENSQNSIVLNIAPDLASIFFDDWRIVNKSDSVNNLVPPKTCPEIVVAFKFSELDTESMIDWNQALFTCSLD